MTLQELSDWYFTYYAPNNLKEITIYNYTNIAQRFLLSALGDLPLEEFNNMQLTEFFGNLPISPDYSGPLRATCPEFESHHSGE